MIGNWEEEWKQMYWTKREMGKSKKLCDEYRNFLEYIYVARVHTLVFELLAVSLYACACFAHS